MVNAILNGRPVDAARGHPLEARPLAKPWWLLALERETGCVWEMKYMTASVVLTCGHVLKPTKITCVFPWGLGRPFLNDEAAGKFIPKAVRAHRETQLQ